MPSAWSVQHHLGFSRVFALRAMRCGSAGGAIPFGVCCRVFPPAFRFPIRGYSIRSYNSVTYNNTFC